MEPHSHPEVLQRRTVQEAKLGKHAAGSQDVCAAPSYLLQSDPYVESVPWNELDTELARFVFEMKNVDVDTVDAEMHTKLLGQVAALANRLLEEWEIETVTSRSLFTLAEVSDVTGNNEFKESALRITQQDPRTVGLLSDLPGALQTSIREKKDINLAYLAQLDGREEIFVVPHDRQQ